MYCGQYVVPKHQFAYKFDLYVSLVLLKKKKNSALKESLTLQMFITVKKARVQNKPRFTDFLGFVCSLVLFSYLKYEPLKSQSKQMQWEMDTWTSGFLDIQLQVDGSHGFTLVTNLGKKSIGRYKDIKRHLGNRDCLK